MERKRFERAIVALLNDEPVYLTNNTSSGHVLSALTGLSPESSRPYRAEDGNWFGGICFIEDANSKEFLDAFSSAFERTNNLRFWSFAVIKALDKRKSCYKTIYTAMDMAQCSAPYKAAMSIATCKEELKELKTYSSRTKVDKKSLQACVDTINLELRFLTEALNDIKEGE